MLLTRAPLYQGRSPFSCDLHVLGAPLTFVLSQDQTLQLNLVSSRNAAEALTPAELGLWLLQRRVTSVSRAAEKADTDLVLSEDPLVVASSSCGQAACTRGAKASVRFSFQGPSGTEVPDCKGQDY